MLSINFCSQEIIAQRVLNQQPGLEVDDFRLKKGTNTVAFNENIEILINRFGNPTSREYYYLEMDEKDGEIVKYSNNDIYVRETLFDSFILRDNTIKVGFNGSFIKVGDNISQIASFYPSYTTYRKYDQKFQTNYISIPFQKNGVLWDVTLVISYDSNNIVTEIMKYEP